jgi:hypothetical protein
MTASLARSTYAAVMGDIAGSESVDDAERLHTAFNDAIDNQNIKHADALSSPLTITLGDEFQGLAKDLTSGISIVRNLRLLLLRQDLECRFSIGVVKLETKLNPGRAWNMLGSGLALTREKLDQKLHSNLYRFSLPGNATIESLLESLGLALTSIERRWTKKQLLYISDALMGNDVQGIAKLRNTSAHSVYKVRAAGDFDLYINMWNSIHEVMRELDGSYQFGVNQ